MCWYFLISCNRYLVSQLGTFSLFSPWLLNCSSSCPCQTRNLLIGVPGKEFIPPSPIVSIPPLYPLISHLSCLCSDSLPAGHIPAFLSNISTDAAACCLAACLQFIELISPLYSSPPLNLTSIPARHLIIRCNTLGSPSACFPLLNNQSNELLPLFPEPGPLLNSPSFYL